MATARLRLATRANANGSNATATGSFSVAMDDRFGDRREFQCDRRWDDRGWLQLRRQRLERDRYGFRSQANGNSSTATGNHSSATGDTQGDRQRDVRTPARRPGSFSNGSEFRNDRRGHGGRDRQQPPQAETGSNRRSTRHRHQRHRRRHNAYGDRQWRPPPATSNTATALAPKPPAASSQRQCGGRVRATSTATGATRSRSSITPTADGRRDRHWQLRDGQWRKRGRLWKFLGGHRAECDGDRRLQQRQWRQRDRDRPN